MATRQNIPHSAVRGSDGLPRWPRLSSENIHIADGMKGRRPVQLL